MPLPELTEHLAHELNTPLGALLIALESAEARADDPEVVRKFLRLARRATEQAAAVVRELSDREAA